jgi:hypothetical protein
MAIVVGLLGLVGILAGSLHSLGLALALSELAAFTWFAAALGTWISLRTGATMGALAHVMACLLIVNGGSVLITLPLLSFRPLPLVGYPPALLAASLASYGEFSGRTVASGRGTFRDTMLSESWVGHGTEMVVACLASVLVSAAGAWALTRFACRGFDAPFDRPSMISAVAGESAVGGPMPPPWVGFRGGGSALAHSCLTAKRWLESS